MGPSIKNTKKEELMQKAQAKTGIRKKETSTQASSWFLCLMGVMVNFIPYKISNNIDITMLINNSQKIKCTDTTKFSLMIRNKFRGVGCKLSSSLHSNDCMRASDSVL